MTDIAENLQRVRQRIAEACAAAGRDPATVRLLAVSKTFGIDAILAAQAAGQHEFGENYVQEALAKQAALGARSAALCWHYIGPIQSNKTRDIAEHFAWVHGVDRLKIAERLSAQRPSSLAPLNVCVQVNISGETSKSGCTPQEVPALCAAVARLPQLKLRGLMAVPAPAGDHEDPRMPFHALHELFTALRQEHHEADTLSAGMSDDLEAAIMEGSTLVRIGTAIFGSRPRKLDGVP